MTYARTSLGGSLPALNDLAPQAGLCRADLRVYLQEMTLSIYLMSQICSLHV